MGNHQTGHRLVKKRSKLDLSQGVEQQKSQASGFEPDVPKDTVSATQKSGQQSAKTNTSRESRSSEAATSPRTSQARIVKTVAVVALAALSLYLLKRRLL